ncbi:hypothetical protein [Neorhizobium lilium]|uniref:hypothetical protein n=1 Tax=Neorhizobium lilium TaxID=2503024 RepID=UPI0013E30C10|nr:hypothetical protein [Neorhizobium lilium]
MTLSASAPVSAEEIIKVGLILPMTGPFASTRRQVSAGAKTKTFMATKGGTVAAGRSSL